MNELERLVVALALLLGVDGTMTKEQLKDLSTEARALLETVEARSESARGYHMTRRGIDALERRRARADKREPDYEAARAAAVTGGNH